MEFLVNHRSSAHSSAARKPKANEVASSSAVALDDIKGKRTKVMELTLLSPVTGVCMEPQQPPFAS